MKKSIIYVSAVAILFFTLMSFRGSADAVASGFTPFKVGQSYKIFIVGSFGGESDIRVLEAQKGPWVKVDIDGMGVRYLNTNNIATITVR